MCTGVTCIYTYMYQCSPQHTKGILAQYPFTMDFSLMWEWGGAKSFDVAAGSTQNMPFQYALPLAWGEHCVHVHIYAFTCVWDTTTCTIIWWASAHVPQFKGSMYIYSSSFHTNLSYHSGKLFVRFRNLMNSIGIVKLMTCYFRALHATCT